MLSKAVEQALNEQIKNEFEASYLYLSMSAHFDAEGLGGFAQWMRLQSSEEQTHALKLFDYVLARGGTVKLAGLGAPPNEFGAPLDIMKQTLAHEQKVTQLINALYGKASEERDFVTSAELQWFLTEHVEEEKTAGDIVQRLTRAGGDANALLTLDRELGSRTAAD